MSKHRYVIGTLVSAAAGLAAAGLIAGCSSGSGTSAVANATGASNAGSAAYTACLSQHGVTLPSRGAFGGGRRSGGAGFTPGAGRSGAAGGIGGAFASANPSMSAALQDCASLRPSGSATGVGGGSSRLTAFRSCMTQQGETLPTARPTAAATAAPTGAARYLNGLNPADPKVQAALKVCQPLIPTTSAKPSATPTSTS